MNGIKYIREKSNFTRNALAERMGVTRQTVTLWERGARKPDKKHLKWLCDFYGVEEKWFGELSDADMEILKEMKMYRHFDGDKEYFSFIPENGGWGEIRVACGELGACLTRDTPIRCGRKKSSCSMSKTTLCANIAEKERMSMYACLIRLPQQSAE